MERKRNACRRGEAPRSAATLHGLIDKTICNHLISLKTEGDCGRLKSSKSGMLLGLNWTQRLLGINFLSKKLENSFKIIKLTLIPKNKLIYYVFQKKKNYGLFGTTAPPHIVQSRESSISRAGTLGNILTCI